MRKLAGLLLVLILAGCTTLSTPPLVPGQSAAGLTAWQLNGRVSLTRGEEGWHASLYWKTQPDAFLLKVSGPLGQGGFQLTGDTRGVVLVAADGQRYAARDADTLLAQVTDWQLPVTGLRYWIRGLPAPADGQVQSSHDEVGRLRHLEQSGWEINYQKYQLVGDMFLPTKLLLTQADVSVRIIIDQWEPGDVVARLP